MHLVYGSGIQNSLCVTQVEGKSIHATEMERKQNPNSLMYSIYDIQHF